MKPAFALLALALAGLCACHRGAPAEHAAKDARDIAMVERAQRMKPPAQLMTPEPVSFADLDTPGIDIRVPRDVPKPRPGQGCGFIAAPGASGTPAQGPEPVFVAVPKLGFTKQGGLLEAFAADSGSPVLASGLHARYASGLRVLTLTQGVAAAAGQPQPASLTVRDKYDRIVYFAAGELRCGARERTPA